MSGTYNGSEGGFIDLVTARQYFDNYKASNVFSANNGIKAHYFGRNWIDQILGQPGCVGLRIYYGQKEEEPGVFEAQLMAIGVDANGDDILSAEMIADITDPCPKLCPENGLEPN